MGRRAFTTKQIINKLRRAEELPESCRKDYNHVQPYSSIEYRPLAPVAIQPTHHRAGLTVQVVQSLGDGPCRLI